MVINLQGIIATKHAYEQAKARFKWKPKTLDRMMIKAYYNGLTHAEVSGKLAKYYDKLYLSHRNASNVRIYGENVYVFTNNILITIFRVPRSLIGYLGEAKNDHTK